LQRGLGLLLRDAPLQTTEGVNPTSAARFEHVFGVPDDDLRLHHDGNENFRGEAQFDAVKARLRDADDGHFVVIEVQSSTDDLGITSETCLPKVVIENNEGMTAWNDIVLGSEDAPHGRDDAKSGEVGAGNEFHEDAFRLLAKGKARRSGKPAKHIGEHFVVIAKITEHRMRNGVATPVAAVMAALHGEKHELLWILDRKEAQEDLVEQAEDGSIGADTEGKSQDGDSSKAGSAGERAVGVFQIAKYRVEPADERQVASGIIGSFVHRYPRAARDKYEEVWQKFGESTKDSWVVKTNARRNYSGGTPGSGWRTDFSTAYGCLQNVKSTRCSLKEITCLRSRTVWLHPDSGRVTGYPEVTPGQKFGSGRGVMPCGHHQASDLAEDHFWRVAIIGEI